jgi:uncharacterized protein (TIGR02266 family)
MISDLSLVRVRLKYADLETFAERFAPNVTRGGIFLASREPRPVGTLVRFEVSLQSGTPVLIGKGRVTWTKAYDPQEPSRPYGMGVQFTELDPASRPVLDRLLVRRADPTRAATGQRGPAPTARAESETAKTQPLRRLSPSPPPGRPFGEELRSLDQVTDEAVAKAVERARALAAEVKDVEDLLHAAEESPPTLSQALADFPRYLGLRKSDPVH